MDYKSSFQHTERGLVDQTTGIYAHRIKGSGASAGASCHASRAVADVAPARRHDRPPEAGQPLPFLLRVPLAGHPPPRRLHQAARILPALVTPADPHTYQPLRPRGAEAYLRRPSASARYNRVPRLRHPRILQRGAPRRRIRITPGPLRYTAANQ